MRQTERDFQHRMPHFAALAALFFLLNYVGAKL